MSNDAKLNKKIKTALKNDLSELERVSNPLWLKLDTDKDVKK